MRILCRNRQCIYQQLGECTLSRAASPGSGNGDCVYYIGKAK